MKKITILSLLLVASLSTFAQKWSVDKAHSKIGFSVVHMMLSDVDGSFKKFDASITSSKEDFSDAVFEFTIDVNTINTDNDTRDGHLKGDGFFDTANYPSITFKSNSVQKGSGKALKVTGDLTMHGVTKPVTFDVTLNGIGENRQKKKLAGFKVVGNIKRSDFGVGGKTPSAVVSDEIELKANGEFVQN
ncbi:YceI family protein [Flectobacillus roseus]|uniref:YceI family protein n=1 Tax=Flectobacillus roseus TaxID=502259 RepID=A0ABT6Y6J5_9BACT|nr:YceI family protein [Flectobacillus roseus]MDI9859190.1 YceI family protein [Flectobacillus roseus]MDI9868115.1 YceI family protein [Flectobacillus roseus]